MRDSGKDWLKNIHDKVQRLREYSVIESIPRLANKLGESPSNILKLNANENFFVPLDFLKELLLEVVDEVDPRLYPVDEMVELREAIGRYLKVSPAQIVLGAGSDPLIELMCQILLSKGDHALSIRPTFSMYEHSSRMQGASFGAVALREDFSLEPEEMLKSITSKTKVIFLCSPNNPTAKQLDFTHILRILESFQGLVVVDEAYVDFAEDSLVNVAENYDNLMVFRTFSKAFGLAGLRLGYAVTNEDLAATITKRVQMPYNVSSIPLKLGVKLLENIQVIRKAVEQTKAERSRLIKNLNEIKGVKAFPSDTNFVLFSIPMKSDQAYQAFLDRGVIVRNLGQVLHLENCMRVAVAPPLIRARFLDSLSAVLGEDNA